MYEPASVQQDNVCVQKAIAKTSSRLCDACVAESEPIASINTPDPKFKVYCQYAQHGASIKIIIDVRVKKLK